MPSGLFSRGAFPACPRACWEPASGSRALRGLIVWLEAHKQCGHCQELRVLRESEPRPGKEFGVLSSAFQEHPTAVHLIPDLQSSLLKSPNFLGCLLRNSLPWKQMVHVKNMLGSQHLCQVAHNSSYWRPTPSSGLHRYYIVVCAHIIKIKSRGKRKGFSAP